MRLPLERRRDAVALLVVIVAALAGLTAWLVGDVDLGFTLTTDSAGYVRVASVDPESLAAENGITPGAYVEYLASRDSGEAQTREAPFPVLDAEPSGSLPLVVEQIPDAQVDLIQVVALESDGNQRYVSSQGFFGRADATARLERGGLLLLVGIAIAFIGAGMITRGWLGTSWSEEGFTTASAVATPLAALPLLYTGSWWGLMGGGLLTVASVLPLSWSLADVYPDASWRPRLKALAVGIAVIAIIILLRGVAGHEYPGTLTGRTLVLAMLPAMLGLAAALTLAGTSPAWATPAFVGIAAGAVVLAQARLSWSFAPVVVTGLAAVAWAVLPAAQRAWLARRARPSEGTSSAADTEMPWESASLRGNRDAVAGLTAVATFAIGLMQCCDSAAVIYGAIVGSLFALALSRGLLGPTWASAAVPIGVAVGVPIMALNIGGSGTDFVLRLLLPGLSALVVAHLLAWRHADRTWRRLLFGWSVVLVGLVILLVLVSPVVGGIGGGYDFPDSGSRLAIYLLLGFIALVPGLGTAMTSSDPAGGSPANRLDLVAMGLTPGAAMTVLPGSAANFILLVGWLIVVIAWRRLTIAPLLGLAQRTQRQRDLAVAAVEAERARLAADIHDDALQELSALVRRLDSAGDAEGADLARSVAERLRAITSDLRLPLLDDLGAGPALEWLVGRFQPLTEGVVRLERIDPSRPPAGVELAVFRVAQEAIANAVKHGKPPITVRYRVDEAGAVSLSVDDEGPGIEPDAPETALRAGHLGVANMQQRAEQIGALLDIRRWPGGGTHVALEWRPR